MAKEIITRNQFRNIQQRYPFVTELADILKLTDGELLKCAYIGKKFVWSLREAYPTSAEVNAATNKVWNAAIDQAIRALEKLKK